jgi:hypothetical protein
MSARRYHPEKMTVGGWYISEKLEGTRVFWDGGISRSLPIIDVPWANVVDPKTGRMKRKIKSEATGLWSKYGNPITAPDWFLNLLPCMPLDGMIWAGRGNLQHCRTTCGGDDSGEGWDEAEFAVFSCPPIDKIFGDGEIRNSRMKLKLLKQNFDLWLHRYDRPILEEWYHLTTETGNITFDVELATLREAIPSEGSVYLLQQKRLPCNVKVAAQAVEKELERIVKEGGAGVMMRSPDNVWEPKRVGTFLEYGSKNV